VLLGNAALGGGTFIDTDDEEFSGFCRFAATLEDIPLDRPIYRVRLEGPPGEGISYELDTVKQREPGRDQVLRPRRREDTGPNRMEDGDS
jgi:hypothetical protein